MCNNAELNGLELMYVSMHTHKLILKGTTVFLLERGVRPSFVYERVSTSFSLCLGNIR